MTLRHIIFNHDLMQYINSCNTICVRRRQWHPTPVLLPGKSHGWRSLVGCRLWVHTESDTTEVTQHSIAYNLCHSEKGLLSLEAQKKEIQEVNDGNVLPDIFWKYISQNLKLATSVAGIIQWLRTQTLELDCLGLNLGFVTYQLQNLRQCYGLNVCITPKFIC